MTEHVSLPFHSFAFTLIEDKSPRMALRLKLAGGEANDVLQHAAVQLDDALYELHVEKGSAANPTQQFTRKVPVQVAQRLKDALQEIGVFAWAEEYPADESGPKRRWNMSIVFRQNVFSVASKGGGVPAGWDAMLEELYRLDFPRPVARKGLGGATAATGGAGGLGAGMPGLGSLLGASGFTGVGGLSAGDLGAYGVAGGSGNMGDIGCADFSQLADIMKGNGLPGLDAQEMSELLSQAGGNPQALQQRLRDEFRHMPRDEQGRLLDALAATGMASRAWWERFLRG